MESPDLRKLRKQIRELRSVSKTGASVAKMSAEDLQNEIDYHTTAGKSIANKLKRNKVVAPVAPVKKAVKKKVVAEEPKSQTRLSPKKKASRSMKILDDSTDDVIQIDNNLEVDEPVIKPRVVKKSAPKIIRELPEIKLKKNVKKAPVEKKEKPIQRLMKTTLSLRRPYQVENDEDSNE